MTEISPLVSRAEPKQEHGQEAALLLAAAPRAQPWHGPGAPSSPAAWEEQQDGDGKDGTATPAAGGQQDGRQAGWRLRAHADGACGSQHRAAGAMGSWKAPLQRAETKAIGSQHFLHPESEFIQASRVIWVRRRAVKSQNQAVQGALQMC